MCIQQNHPCVAGIGYKQGRLIGGNDQPAWRVKLTDTIATLANKEMLLHGKRQVPGVALGHAWGDEVRAKWTENVEWPTVVYAVYIYERINLEVKKKYDIRHRCWYRDR